MTLINDDCLNALKELPENSIDSIISDPPAGIAFMGKSWDKDKGGRDQWIHWMTNVMLHCRRVLKPGAHGFIWALPRTGHWTATAIENSGLEIRDIVTHLFGSGFPKSHNLSKSIDKKFGANRIITDKLKPGHHKGRNKTLGKGSNAYKGGEVSGVAYEEISATDQAKQWDGWGTALKPAWEGWVLIRKPLQSKELLEKTDIFNAQEWEETFLNTEELWQNIWAASLKGQSKSTIKTASEMITELKTLSCLIYALMQAIITQEKIKQNGSQLCAKIVSKSLRSFYGKLKDLNTTIAQKNVSTIAEVSKELIASFQEKECEMMMAPLAEHWILIRKPLSEKTIVDNVLKHGVGGINIDDCRIEGKPRTTHTDGNYRTKDQDGRTMGNAFGVKKLEAPQGRFPANLIVSGDARELLDEQSGELGKSSGGNSRAIQKNTYNDYGKNYDNTPDGNSCGFGDAGGASRFFYCAKSSKSERNEGLEGLPAKKMDNDGNERTNAETADKFGCTRKSVGQNHHPTVKAQKLMRYLITMITPKGGTVLDPFMGSGSTGVAAKALGFDFIGIEKETEYFEIAKARIDNIR